MISLIEILNSDLANGFANGAQLADIILNAKQVSNDTIFKELQRQDDEYFELLLKQNQEVISLLTQLVKKLEKEDKDYGKEGL